MRENFDDQPKGWERTLLQKLEWTIESQISENVARMIKAIDEESVKDKHIPRFARLWIIYFKLRDILPSFVDQENGEEQENKWKVWDVIKQKLEDHYRKQWFNIIFQYDKFYLDESEDKRESSSSNIIVLDKLKEKDLKPKTNWLMARVKDLLQKALWNKS